MQHPTLSQLRELAQTLGFELERDELAVYHEIIADSMDIYRALDELPDHLPPVHYPRTPGYRPEGEENQYGAWYYKTSVKARSRGKLAGKRVALKDTICLAGVPMMDGASSLEGYVPDVDAEVVTRILDAAGEIAGKAVCEYFSYSGGSHTAATGLVQNPRKPGYSSGGSSSGCAVLVAAGEVDMAMGGDQAGSIRVPATHSGIYGLKPTYGLVPYSGILSSEFNVDHTGPMTATVADNALLLEVVAGPDGVDPRQANVKTARYTKALQQGARGLRVGVLQEGFGWEHGEADVDAAVKSAARKLKKLGLEVAEVSIPLHRRGWQIWIGFAVEGYLKNMVYGNGLGTGHGGLFVTSLNDRLRAWRQHVNEFSPGLKFGMLLGEYLNRNYCGHYYGKSINLSRRLAADYDRALSEVDVLLMPTAPQKAKPLPKPDAPIDKLVELQFAYIENTSPFDLTHHPALSVPCGSSDGLPIGMMLVSKHFDEETLYRVAHAYEQAQS
tara:strand:- start:412 stop:1908 length:1497 start_codon:yes stop_codon:yes gene_type:complete